MKAHLILFALCGLGLLVNATAMDIEDEEDDGFHHGFSMADEMDEEEFGLPMNDQEMEDDDLERMADPLRVRIRIRRPPPFGLGMGGMGGFPGIGGYAGLGGYSGLGGMGLSGGFGLGFDEDEERSSAVADDEDSPRSSSPEMEDDSNSEDEERMADPVRIRIRVRPSFPGFDPRDGMEDSGESTADPARFRIGVPSKFVPPGRITALDELMSDPFFRIRMRAGLVRPFGMGFPFGYGGFFPRPSPYFFDSPMENKGSRYSKRGEAGRWFDPLIEDITIKERIRIRTPDRYDRYRRYKPYYWRMRKY